MSTAPTPTPTDTLDTASDEELNVTFASEVAQIAHEDIWSYALPDRTMRYTVPEYVNDAGACLHYLSQHEWSAWTQGEGAAKRVFVGIYPGKGERGYAPSSAATFERAVVLALIRRKRAENPLT